MRFILHLRFRGFAAFATFLLSIHSFVWAADSLPILIDVDASEITRKLVHTTMEIPCKPGAMLMVPRGALRTLAD